MRVILLLLLLLCSAIVRGRQHELVSIKDKGQEIEGAFMADVKASVYKSHFRAKLRGGAYVDITSHNDSVFQGEVTYIVYQYKVNARGRQYRKHILYQRTPLDSAIASDIGRKLLRSSQWQYSPDSLTGEYHPNCCGCDYISWSVKTDKYIEQMFVSPKSLPDSLPGKAIIMDNYNLLSENIPFHGIYNEFEHQLPNGYWYNITGQGMLFYKYTERETEASIKAKPKTEYLDTMADTIDYYLLKRLENVKPDSIDCFDEYNLKFKKSGKLKRIGNGFGRSAGSGELARN